MADQSKEWATFVHQCLLRRIPEQDFSGLSKLLFERSPLPGPKTVGILLAGRGSFGLDFEPLVPRYLVTLLGLGCVKLSDILVGLLKSSLLLNPVQLPPQEPQTSSARDTKRNIDNQLASDLNVIQDVTVALSNNATLEGPVEIAKTLAAISKWVSAILSRTANDQLEEGASDTVLTASTFAGPLFEAVGILLLTILDNHRVIDFISDADYEDRKSRIGRTLSSYISLTAQISIPVATKLDTIQKQYDLFERQSSNETGDGLLQAVGGDGLQFEDSVIDSPIVNSRAGLYVYFNAMLVGRPLVDDGNFMAYLNARYSDDHTAIAIELVTAAFDLVSHAMYHNESSQTAFLFRSFLVQKIPVILTYLSASSMGALQTEFCITQALGRIDPNAFPSFSQTFDMSSGNIQLSDVRQEFLFACALHRLIPEESVERILGEDPMQALPSGGLHSKQALMAQMNASSERVEQLIGEIENMDGNASGIVDAVTEVMHELCANKETMTLKSICSALTRKPQVFDVMLLFRSPSNILQPLCTLLDEWRWDDDIGEYQPVYDEFGSILLLILAFKYRYDLEPSDLGVENSQFLAPLFERRATSQRLGDLTESQQQHLGAWITALFIAEGISDELMSSCSPQEFYQLVPTLFSQSLEACDTGKLDIESLKGGFEYLLEPFLLPSLVIAMTWISKNIWEAGTNLSTSLQILDALVNPGSISGEAQATHRTILSITARPLEEALREAKRQDPSRKAEIENLMDSLKPHIPFQRTASIHHKELETWTSFPSGGLLASVRNVLQSLVLWSSTAHISMTPPSYTHRQIIASIRLFGATRVLRTILDELKHETENGSGDIALDIVATMICAPEIGSARLATNQNQGLDKSQSNQSLSTGRLTLHDALLLEYSSLQDISLSDPLLATLITRLHRRCQVLLTPPAPLTIPSQGADQSEQVVETMMQDISNMDEAAASLTAGDAAAINMAAADANEGLDKIDIGDIDSMLDAANAAASHGGDVGVGLGPSGDEQELGDGLDDLMNVTGADTFDLEEYLRS